MPKIKLTSEDALRIRKRLHKYSLQLIGQENLQTTNNAYWSGQLKASIGIAVDALISVETALGALERNGGAMV